MTQLGRRALLVGIDHYDYLEPDLHSSVSDVLALHERLAFHADGSTNYACRLLLGSQPREENSGARVTFTRLQDNLERLFAYDGEVLLYFAGHSIVTLDSVYLATQDGMSTLPGIALEGLLAMAHASPAREVTILLDCCSAGSLGIRTSADLEGAVDSALPLRDGMTILAASRAAEASVEQDGHGVFTRLLLDGLDGGAADVRGNVSAAALYAYAEQALGEWDQRPVYRSNASHLSPLRRCEPEVADKELRRLPELFPQPDYRFALDPTYEATHAAAVPEHVALFHLFKRYQLARLLRGSNDRDLYFAALQAHTVELTALGRYYWKLALDGLLGDPRSTKVARRNVPADAAEVAQLFHDTYERLALAFGYQTRVGTRVPWDKVPTRNQRLMTAVTAEVLAELFADAERL